MPSDFAVIRCERPNGSFVRGVDSEIIETNVFISCKKRRPDHNMMLRAMHMAERHCHHFLDNFHRIFRCLCQTQTYNCIHARSMAFVADIMAMNAPGLTVLFFMSYCTLHKFIFLKIFKRCAADQTFFFHNCLRSSFFCIDDRPHTVRNMLLMSPVNSHTFLAVTMIAVCFLCEIAPSHPILFDCPQ